MYELQVIPANICRYTRPNTETHLCTNKGILKIEVSFIVTSTNYIVASPQIMPCTTRILSVALMSSMIVFDVNKSQPRLDTTKQTKVSGKTPT